MVGVGRLVSPVPWLQYRIPGAVCCGLDIWEHLLAIKALWHRHQNELVFWLSFFSAFGQSVPHSSIVMHSEETSGRHFFCWSQKGRSSSENKNER